MKKLLNKKSITVVLLTAFVVIILTGVLVVSAIPDEIILFENEKPEIGKIFTIDTAAGTQGELRDGVLYKNETEQYYAEVKLAGVLPVKTVRVSVKQAPEVVLGGSCIGVKLYTDGLMVVGVSDFESSTGKIVSPARNSGIKTGDIVKAVNGQAPDTAEDFSRILDGSDGGAVELEIERKNNTITITTVPVMDSDNNYKLGMWIRNSVVGIGTMTFFDPEKNIYGALGHGITDSDTNDIVPIKRGEVVPAKISSLKKSVKGSPGELHGYFADSGAVCDVSENSLYGIYGKANEKSFFSGDVVSVASRREITAGKAQMLSCIDKNEAEAFDIEIEYVSQRKNAQTKCMVIRVTDSRLLSETGGILQGMSGSPILQNGKLVGAVTHVFVNDPTRGYGIFIENMLAESEKIK